MTNNNECSSCGKQALRQQIQDKIYENFGNDQAALIGWLNQMIDIIIEKEREEWEEKIIEKATKDYTGVYDLVLKKGVPYFVSKISELPIKNKQNENE